MRGLKLESLRPAMADPCGDDRGAERTEAQHRHEHLVSPRGAGGTSQRPEALPQGAGVPALRPQAQHGLETTTGHPEIMHAVRLACVRLADVLSERLRESIRRLP